jgi:predicted transcriptional regulator
VLPRVDSIKQMRLKIGITQKKLRLKIGITQKKLASLTGVSTSMINQIESGRSQPSYHTAKKIFDILGDMEGKSSSHKAGDFCSQDIVKLKPVY